MAAVRRGPRRRARRRSARPRCRRDEPERHAPRVGIARDAVLPTYARADLTIVRGEGCRVWDDEGRAYLDFGAGIAVVGLGHRHPASPRRRTRSSTGSGTRRTSTGRSRCCGSPGLLSERLGGAQAFFCNSGAEANEAALKVARKATGRSRIVALEGGFHGRTLGALSATGQPAKWEGFGPLVPGVSFARPNDVESLEAAVAPGGDTRARSCSSPCSAREAWSRSRRASSGRPPRSRARSGRFSASTRCRPGSAGRGRSSRYEQLGIEPGSGDPRERARQRAADRRAARPRSGRRRGSARATTARRSAATRSPAAAACAVVEAIDEELLANVARRGAQLRRASRSCPACARCGVAGCSSARVLDRDGRPRSWTRAASGVCSC